MFPETNDPRRDSLAIQGRETIDAMAGKLELRK